MANEIKTILKVPYVFRVNYKKEVATRRNLRLQSKRRFLIMNGMTSHHEEHRKKLYRSKRDRIIFGVCGGLSEYFEIDPTIVRLAFVLLALASGIGIVAYIIFALVTPARPNPSAGREWGPKEEGDETAPSMEDKVKEFVEGSAEYVVEGSKRLAEEAREAMPAHAVEGSRKGKLAAFFGVILIVFGVAFLLDNLFPYGYFHRKLLWPFLLVVLGIFLAARKKN